MGNKWRFGFRFMYLSFIILLLWFTVSDRYHRFLGYVASFPLKVIGYDAIIVETTVEDILYRHSGKVWLFPVGNVTANFIPFLSLVLSTPKTGILKKLKVIGIGMGVLFLFHVSSVISIPLIALIRSYFGHTEFLLAAVTFLNVIVIGLIPLLLWIYLVFGDRLSFKRQEGATEPH